MIDRIEETSRQLTSEDVGVLEAAMGIQLPDDYRSFLLKFNGGRPIPNGFPIEGMYNNPFGTIQVFFGVDNPIESCNIAWNFDVARDRLPGNLLPIACTGTGDIICLSISGDDTGAVVFWDHEAEHSPPTYGNVYRIATTFAEFIANIHVVS